VGVSEERERKRGRGGKREGTYQSKTALRSKHH